jgi:GTP pyrophosphokinase
MTDANSSPKLDWLNIATTTQAKSKIKSYFSKQDRENYITRGKDLLEKELRKRNISIKEALSEDNINKLIDDLRVANYEEILLNIGSLRYTPVYIVDLIYNNKENVEDAFLDKLSRQQNTKTNYANDIIVSGMDDLLVNLASCCRPVYGDEIIGYITKGRGITVHKKDCVNIHDINDRLIDVKWNDGKSPEDRKYISHIKVFTNDTNSSLMDIVAKATTRNIQMTSINEKNVNDRLVYDLLIKVSSKEDLDLYINDLEMLKYVDLVKRY